VHPVATGPKPRIYELRTGGTDDEQSDARTGRYAIEEPYELRVGPVQIIDPDHDRPIRGKTAEITPPGMRQRLEALGRAEAEQPLINENAGAVRDCRDSVGTQTGVGDHRPAPRVDRFHRRLSEVARKKLVERGLCSELRAGSTSRAKDVCLSAESADELLGGPRLPLARRRDEERKDGVARPRTFESCSEKFELSSSPNKGRPRCETGLSPHQSRDRYGPDALKVALATTDERGCR